MTDYGWLEIYPESASAGKGIVVRFGDGQVRWSGGGYGWQSVQRPKKRALTVRRGPTDALQCDIPIIMDAWRSHEGRDVEDMVTTLETWAGINVFEGDEPPLLILNANGALAHDVVSEPHHRWVIPTIPDFGEAIRRESDGKRVRQLATVTFMLFTTNDQISRDKQVSNAHFTTARQGDTYNKIAAREFRSHGGIRWGNRLAHFNNARDGAVKLRVGQLVKLPSTALLKQWERTPRR